MKDLYCLLFMLLSSLHIAISQTPAGCISGTVTDDKGKAVQGVAVTIIQTGQGRATGAHGEFVINNVAAGNYHVRISAVGLKPQVVKTSVKQGQQVILAISAEADVNALNEVSINTKPYNPDNLIDFQRTAMPVTVITRKQIDQMGSRRLDEVLKEQTGLAIVSDVGAGPRAVGLQMQGFDSGYTMILIDGQPMTGRNSGNFDLSRITVANIERIEIIKGASSCLFGSEAMAGAINIVTRQRISQSQGMASVRYGSFNVVDANLEGEAPFAGGRGAGYIGANYYRTDGFNANPYLTEGKTVYPYSSYTIQGRGRYALSEINSLNFTGRFASRESVNDKSFNSATQRDAMSEDDLNASAVLNTNLKSGLRLKTQYYLTRYSTRQNNTDLTSTQTLTANNFTQYLHRGEVQVSRSWQNAFTLTGGAGTQYETMDNTLYGGSRSQQNSFAYTQADWQLTNKTTIVGGLRLEHHNRYGSSLTPSFGIDHKINHVFTLKAAVASGFKTPDYRQLYMVFTNFAGGGYTVLGNEVFSRELQRLQQNGEISSVFPNADRVGQLKAERSVSYSAGFAYTPGNKISIQVNGFYNNVRNFINTEQVASKSNGQQVFSYFNIDRVFLTGVEVNGSIKAARGLTISAGYQMLYAKDRGVIDSIKAGTGDFATVHVPETATDRRSTTADYFGLTNRSRHMANLRFVYEYEPKEVTGTLRVNYRGKYGFMEAGRRNNFLDPYDTYVPGYFLLNASVQKALTQKHLALQVIIDNIMNYRHELMPANSGRTILLGVSYRFF
ncbi:TonB-dependent receptor [Mucilaginibacter defluvii]|uniref:TonB-dependent receptor n=1 Tax=Mucilaginibacter defluvii TaxID=1196019 RepID=A0ABP9FU36_9SPHI